MKIYANQLASNLSQSLAGCYLIFGDEPFQINDARQQIRDKARASGINEFIRLADDDTFEWQDLQQHCSSMSLFSDAKLIELELTTNKIGKLGSDALKAIAPQLNHETILVVFGGKLEAAQTKSAWFKALSSVGVYIPVYEIEGQHLNRWLQSQLTNKGLRLDNDAQSYLLSFTAGNLLACSQELDKLKLAFPNEPIISLEMVEKYVADQSRYNVFQLMDALWQNNANQCVTILSRLKLEEFEPNIILWALQKDTLMLNELIEAKQNNLATKPIFDRNRIWQNKQSSFLNAATRLKSKQVSTAIQQLSELDQSLKFSTLACPYTIFAHICLLLCGHEQMEAFQVPSNASIN